MAENTIGTAYIQILPSTKGLSDEIGKSLPSMPTLPTPNTRGYDTMRQKMVGVGKSITAVGGLMTLLGGKALSLGKNWMEMANQAQQSQTKLKEVMHAMMGATDDQVKEVNKLIDSETRSGVVGGTSQRNGAQQLATYLHTTGALKELIPAMNDLAVQQYGTNVTSEEMTNTANMMGKVFAGNVGALRRAGITFDESSEYILKYGTEEEKAAELAKVINQNVGNMNQEMAKTPAGKLQQAKNNLSAIATKIGSQILPIIASVAQWLSKHVMPIIQKIVDFLAAHPTITKIIVALTAFLAIGGAVMTAIGGFMLSINLLNISLAPTMGIIAAIMGAIAAVILIVTHWGQITKWFKDVFATAMGAVKDIIDAVKGLFTGLGSHIKAKFTAIRDAASNAWQGIKNAAIAPFAALKSLGTKTASNMHAAFVKHGGGMKGALAASMAGMRTVASAFYNKLNAMTGGKLGTVVKAFKTKFGSIKSSVSNAMSAARDAVSRGLGRIRDAFRSLRLKFPKPHIPKISIDWEKVKKGPIKLYVPHIHWNAAGGIFTRPTVIGNQGFGEAGPEAVLPLNTFWKRLEQSGRGNTTINMTVNGAEGQDINQLADIIVDKIVLANRRKAAMYNG